MTVHEPCEKCGGSGWLWWHELDNFAGHDPRELVVDDTRYSCDACDGEGVTPMSIDRA